jgi:hypothetical protein
VVRLLASLNRTGVALLIGAPDADVAGQTDAEIIRLPASAPGVRGAGEAEQRA